jgi:hypothetical protein
MSRNHVSKMLIGDGIANLTGAPVTLAALTEGQLIAFDFDKASLANTSISAATINIGFARGTAVLGEAIIAGPIPVSGISDATNNPYAAPVNQVSTLLATVLPTVGKTAIFKVIYHDNLSIIPNQIKSTTIAVTADAVNTATLDTWAIAISDEFNKQTAELGGNLFVTVAHPVANTVTFTGITVATQSKYNHIDRPETLVFEIGAPSDEPEQGTYTVGLTTAAEPGQGDKSKIAWMEEQHMGRLGYADRRMWNNTKKYESQIIAAITDYEVLVVNADQWTEGDMQGLRANPIGAVIATDAAGQAFIEADLAFAGIVPVVVAAHA